MNCLRRFILLKALFLITFVNASTKDGPILIRVKHARIRDPTRKLQNWRPSSRYAPCDWAGVSCNDRSHDVVSINLSGLAISGKFPAEFCRIHTLRNLDISNNNIGGGVDSGGLSLCSKLITLNMSSNYFVGRLPEFKVLFPNLNVLDFSSNNFSGEIPVSFVNLPRLQLLNLGSNLLNGSGFPEYLSNLTELSVLTLALNPFIPSRLPENIGRLTKLERLSLQLTNLVGELPESIGDLSSIKVLDVSTNNLSGIIPKSIGKLKTAYRILLFHNRFTGALPDVFSDLKSLRSFDASENNLTGKIPETLAAQPLKLLHLQNNHLEGEIPEALSQNVNLVQLRLFNNNFSGKLPENLGSSSDLVEIDVSNNNVEGEIPPNLCYRKKLQRLILFQNRISGPIPKSYGECSSLTRLRIQQNKLSGTVPEGLWSFDSLDHIDFTNNRLEGSISPSISCSNSLKQLLISSNNFSGTLPAAICRLHDIRRFHLSSNKFSGELPSCITELTKLEELHIQSNNFTGKIPKILSNWSELTELDLSDNQLSGEIPANLGSLPRLKYLNISNNNISGVIPAELTKLKLNVFDVSNNRLQGKVPDGFDTKYFLPSLMGNPCLCSPDLSPLLPCPKPVSRSKFDPMVPISVLVLSTIGLILIVACLLKSTSSSNLDENEVIQTENGWSDENRVLASLVEQNHIGSGGSGRVYRVRLENGHVVAAKRIRTPIRSSEVDITFLSEIRTLRRVRHRNIIKLLFCCTDGESPVLVYDYMANGSLGDVLYRNMERMLNWKQRFEIAMGIAHGLAYLHHDCVPAIVHRDIKSNNILLDHDFVPKIADFGLAKTLDADIWESDNINHYIIGSYGYIAPEQAYSTRIATKSDVYSFGIVVLELITGKQPNDPSLEEDNHLVNWVKESLGLSCQGEEHQNIDMSCLDKVIDPRMKKLSIDYEEVKQVLNVALLCTTQLPKNRPSMRKVVDLLTH